MRMGDRPLVRFRRKWQGAMVLECLLLALGAGVLGYLSSRSPWISVLMFLVALGIALAVYRPWELRIDRVGAHVDSRLPGAGFSSGVLAKEEGGLTGLPRLQRHRVEARLVPLMSRLGPPNSLGTSLPLALSLVVIGLVLHFVPWGFDAAARPMDPLEQIGFKPLDSLESKKVTPRLIRTTIGIRPPSYTGIPRSQTTNPNIGAVEGSIKIG